MMRSYATWMLVILTLMTTVVVNAETTPNQDGNLTEVIVPGSHMECVIDHKTLTKNLQKLELANQQLVFELKTEVNNSARCQTDLDKVKWNNTVVITALVAMIIFGMVASYKHITAQAGPVVQDKKSVSTNSVSTHTHDPIQMNGHDETIAQLTGKIYGLELDVEQYKNRVVELENTINLKDAQLQGMQAEGSNKIGEAWDNTKLYQSAIIQLQQEKEDLRKQAELQLTQMTEKNMKLEERAAMNVDKFNNQLTANRVAYEQLGAISRDKDATIRNLEHDKQSLMSQLAEEQQYGSNKNDVQNVGKQVQTHVYNEFNIWNTSAASKTPMPTLVTESPSTTMQSVPFSLGQSQAGRVPDLVEMTHGLSEMTLPVMDAGTNINAGPVQPSTPLLTNAQNQDFVDDDEMGMVLARIGH